MGLASIRERIARSPTVMPIDQEAGYLAELMELSPDDLIDQWGMFNEIITELADSHTDAYFDLSDANRGFFDAFASWLGQLATRLNGPRGDWLTQLASHFAMDPSELRYDE